MFSAIFALCHHIFETPFFLLHEPTSYWQFLGLISFMLLMFATMPLLMLLTKWMSIGKWNQHTPTVYFNLSSRACRLYFSFMGCPVWTSVRNVWQPRFYGTWIQNLWYRLLGAKIGSRVLIYSNGVEDYDNLTLEDDAAVCHGCFVMGHIWEGNGLSFGDTVVRAGATIMTDRQVWPGGDVQSREIVEGSGQPIRGKWPRPPKPQPLQSFTTQSMRSRGERQSMLDTAPFPEGTVRMNGNVKLWQQAGRKVAAVQRARNMGKPFALDTVRHTSERHATTHTPLPAARSRAHGHTRHIVCALVPVMCARRRQKKQIWKVAWWR